SSFYTYHLSQLPIYKHFLCTTLFRSLADLLIVVAVDERADALVGEDFVDEAVEDAAVHHVDARHAFFDCAHGVDGLAADGLGDGDRKSTRLNYSHLKTTYAFFCFNKK